MAARFVDVILEYAGEIPDDDCLRRAIRGQRPVLDEYPSSPLSCAFKKLAAHAEKPPVPAGPRGNIEFFVERLVQRTATRPQAVS